MAWGRRCEIGCESWPDEPRYAKCVHCGEKTTLYRNLTPIDPDEARSIVLHVEFESYYEGRCERLGIPVDGPLPEPTGTSRPPRIPMRRDSGGDALVRKDTRTDP